MRTQKPLREMAETLATHIMDYNEYLLFNKRLLNVFEGQLRTEIEAEMRQELSPKSFERARHRIPSFNLLSRITNKLSKVYMKPAIRTSSADSKMVANWEKWTQFDDKMRQANIMLNLHKTTAVEPYLQEGRPKIRVIPAHAFLPFSDSPFDPTDMTVFLKFVGSKMVANTFTDINGNLVDPDGTIEMGRWVAYSDTEIMRFEVSSRGDVVMRPEDITPNPLGKIAQTVLSRSDFQLIPTPDSDSLSNTILIPKMYANLAYAVNLQAHGQLIAIDLDIEGATLSKGPDQLWAFNTSDDSMGKQGKIDAVKVEIDIEEVNNLVQNILSIWLETRNVKVGTAGKAGEQRASGAAKIIDSADASEDIEIQKGIFSMAERNIWEKISLLNNNSLDQIDSKMSPKAFSENFEIQVSFQLARPLGSPIDAINFIREQMSLGLMNREQAIKTLHPEFTEEQITKWLADVKTDEAFLEGITSGTSGQFGSGNQASAKDGSGSQEPKGSSGGDDKNNPKKD